MSNRKHIQLFGTPSTSYTYIRHIFQKVISRAGLSLTIEEVNDIDAIVKNKVNAIPALRINGKTYEFTDEENFNELLKKAVLDFLKSEKYGRWPVVLLQSGQLGTAHCFAQELAKDADAAIEWILDDPGPLLDVMSHDLLPSSIGKLIKQRQKDWMDQILSSPLIDYVFTEPSEKTRCIQIASERNAIALVSDLPLKENWPLITHWAKHSQTAFIHINGQKAYHPPQHISVLHGSECPKSSELLLRLVQGKKERISFSCIHESQTEAKQTAIENSNWFSNKNSEGNSIISRTKPDIYALQIEERDQLIQFLEKEDVREWLTGLEQPLILLPPEINGDEGKVGIRKSSG